jgi:hypothetical protein
VVLLAGLLAFVGLTMLLAPRGFGRLAHGLRASIPASTEGAEKITTTMGVVVLAAAIVVVIAWA